MRPNSFEPNCSKVKINQNSIFKFLMVRAYFRAMAVLEPLKVTIENFPSDSKIDVQVPNFPQDESRGHHTVPFDRVVYIDAVDFQEV